MRIRILAAASLLALAGFVATGFAPRATASTGVAAPFEVDSAHSMVIFRVRHFGVSNFYGRVNMPKGTFLLDPADPAGSRISVELELKNMDAGNKDRDRFLLSPDFFNAREHPSATFASTAVRSLGDGAFEVDGDFTMRGVTKRITARIDGYTEAQTTKFGYRAGFEAVFDVKRSDHGMNLFVEEGTLGDEVRMIVSLEGVRRP